MSDDNSPGSASASAVSAPASGAVVSPRDRVATAQLKMTLEALAPVATQYLVLQQESARAQLEIELSSHRLAERELGVDEANAAASRAVAAGREQTLRFALAVGVGAIVAIVGIGAWKEHIAEAVAAVTVLAGMVSGVVGAYAFGKSRGARTDDDDDDTE